MSVYSTVKTIYKAVLPKTVRKAIFRIMPKPLKLSRQSFIRKLEKSANFDEIYDEKYYTNGGLNPVYKNSCAIIAECIVKFFSPKRVVDVGCGIGVLLLALKKCGVFCLGLDYSSAALENCRQNGLDVIMFDLRHDILPQEVKADVVVSTEVAEHLPEIYADRFVDILCAIADNVVLTAAEPAVTYVGDHTHVNEQPKKYWIEKFVNKGFTYSEDIVTQLRTEWKEHKIKPWFIQHLMVFRKQQSSRHCLF
jgi:cyclopropane fatty-acyl-phospholipid synthase-like methyltransferase